MSRFPTLIGANRRTAKAKARYIMGQLVDLMTWIGAAEYWEMKAEEMQTIAENMRHDEIKVIMERIARDYHWLAECEYIARQLEETLKIGKERDNEP